MEAPAAAATAGLRRTVSLPPSPARASVRASMPGLEEQFAELQSVMSRSFTAQRRTAHTGGRVHELVGPCVQLRLACLSNRSRRPHQIRAFFMFVQVPAALRPPPAPPAAAPAASPQPASPAVAAVGASPSLNWFASPLAQSDTLSAISMGNLGQSPDVFAGLESPAVAAASPAAAPAAQRERSPAPPASVGSTGMGASLSAKLSRLVRRPWSRSPAAAGSSTKSADGRGANGTSASVGAALDAADAGRTGGLVGWWLVLAAALLGAFNPDVPVYTKLNVSPEPNIPLLLQPPCCA